MATIGLSRPYIAKYINTDGVITYEGGKRMGKAVKVSVEIESGDPKDFYADNGVCESDRSFAGGKLGITTDDLEQDVSALILGVTTSEITVGEERVTEIVYDDSMEAPDLGFGVIIKKKKGGVYKWRAIVLTKIKFSVPSDSATTQGESIEWQTPEAEATIMRDDSERHAWKREATFDTEAKAEAYIKQVLEIGEGTPE